MYEIVAQTPKEIVLTYVVVLAACALTYPIVNLIGTILAKGAKKWN